MSLRLAATHNTCPLELSLRVASLWPRTDRSVWEGELKWLAARRTTPSSSTFPCNHRKCNTCAYTASLTSIQPFQVRQVHVHLLYCSRCSRFGLYIGETRQPLRWMLTFGLPKPNFLLTFTKLALLPIVLYLYVRLIGWPYYKHSPMSRDPWGFLHHKGQIMNMMECFPPTCMCILTLFILIMTNQTGITWSIHFLHHSRAFIKMQTLAETTYAQQHLSHLQILHKGQGHWVYGKFTRLIYSMLHAILI